MYEPRDQFTRKIHWDSVLEVALSIATLSSHGWVFSTFQALPFPYLRILSGDFNSSPIAINSPRLRKALRG